jgi:transposase-like protein
MKNNDTTQKEIRCPKCSSIKFKKRGFRTTKNRGRIQRYECKKCKKAFVKNEGFYRMRNTPQKITLCLDLFFRGISLRKIQEHLQSFYPQNSSHVSIYNWIVKYSNMINNFTDRLNLKVGSEIQIDEMEYNTKGEKSWFVDVIDTKTRYMVSSKFVKKRTIKELKNVLSGAKRKTRDQVKVVTTDGLLGYPRVLRKTFGLYGIKSRSKITHNVVIADENGFNHKIERLHNSIRERTKTFRGFGSLEGAKAIMKGYEIFYNFMRKHQAINKYPYELAVPELKLGANKWLDLIKLSKLPTRFLKLESV